MKEIMLDLETLSTRPDASIISIGAVDINNLEDTFYQNTYDPKGRIDINTVFWHLRNKTIPEINHINLDYALSLFRKWLPPSDQVIVWGNGADFDNVILQQAYSRINQVPPWNYRNNRCFRTIKCLFPQILPPPFEGTPHNALHDAVHQARWLNEIRGHG